MPKLPDFVTVDDVDNFASTPIQEQIKNRPCVIYCRVSGKKQDVDGSGLSSQEFRCRSYASGKDYVVEKCFYDKKSGGGDFMTRPGMVELLKFLDKNKNKHYVVLFDDLSRYSRDLEFHINLRKIMNEKNATRECLNFRFEDSPIGKHTEDTQIANAELYRSQMAVYNKQRQEARLEQGYATFSRPPIGYKFVKSTRGGMEIVRDEPVATIVQEALTGFATNRFSSQSEVKRFLESQPEFPKYTASGTVSQQRVVQLLTRPMYAGYVGAPKWGIPYRDGNHEALISKAMFKTIREKLERGVYAPAREDLHSDFPLRGAVLCSHCDKPLRGHWSKGKTKSYAYYTCHTRVPEKCQAYGKGIPRAKLQGEFETILSTLQPSLDVMGIFKELFQMSWELLKSQISQDVESMKAEIKKVDKEINQVVDRVVHATNDRVIARYEQRIGDLEEQKAILMEKKKNPFNPKYSYRELIELSGRFLQNPYEVWRSERLILRRMVLKLVFSEPLSYSRETGYRTPQITLPFKVLEELKMQKKKMVPPPRVELGTC